MEAEEYFESRMQHYGNSDYDGAQGTTQKPANQSQTTFPPSVGNHGSFSKFVRGLDTNYKFGHFT